MNMTKTQIPRSYQEFSILISVVLKQICKAAVTCDLLRRIGCLQTFLSEGHLSCLTTVQGSDIWRNVIVSGCYILPNQQFFGKYMIFSLLTKCLCGWRKRFRGPNPARSLETMVLGQPIFWPKNLKFWLYDW